MAKNVDWNGLDHRDLLPLLAITLIDLEQARRAAVLFLRNIGSSELEKSELKVALGDICIIRYARCFTTRRFAGGTLQTILDPARFIVNFSVAEKAVHDKFLNLRNKVTAHSDESHKWVDLVPLSDAVGGQWGVSIAHEYPDDDDIRLLDSMVTKISVVAQPLLNAEADKLRGNLPGGIALPAMTPIMLGKHSPAKRP